MSMTQEQFTKFEYIVASPFWSPTYKKSVVINDFSEIRATRSNTKLGEVTEDNIDTLFNEWEENK